MRERATPPADGGLEQSEATSVWQEAGQRLRETVQSLQSVQLCQTPEGKSRQREILDTIGERTFRCVQRLAQIGLLATVGLAAHHYGTQRTVEQRPAGAKTEYHHPDEETEHILNYIAGKEALGDQERAKLIVLWLEDIWAKRRRVLPPEVRRFNLEQLRRFIIDSNTDAEGGKIVGEWWAKFVFDGIPAQFPANEKIYEALWDIERGSGGPHIRWDPAEDVVASAAAGERRHLKGEHHPLTNTIDINPFIFYKPAMPLESELQERQADLAHVYAAEAAHGNMLHNYPAETYLNAVVAGLRIAGDMVYNWSSFSTSYDKEYDRPGSIEYDAHQVVEPQLKSRLAPHFPRSPHFKDY